jgi:hypothetical protein
MIKLRNLKCQIKPTNAKCTKKRVREQKRMAQKLARSNTVWAIVFVVKTNGNLRFGIAFTCETAVVVLVKKCLTKGGKKRFHGLYSTSTATCFAYLLVNASVSIGFLRQNSEWLGKIAITFSMVPTIRITVVILELLRAKTRGTPSYQSDIKPMCDDS